MMTILTKTMLLSVSSRLMASRAAHALRLGLTFLRPELTYSKRNKSSGDLDSLHSTPYYWSHYSCC